MEILDLKFAGVSLWVWVGIACVYWFLGNAYYATQEWMAERARIKEEEKGRDKNREHNEWIAREVARGVGEAVERQLRKERGEPIE